MNYHFPKRLLIIFVCLSSVQYIHSIVVRGEIWRKKRDDKSYCYVYNMYDQHVGALMSVPELGNKVDFKKLISRSEEQFQSLVQKLKALDPKDILVLVEDSYTYRNGNTVLPENLTQILSKIAKTDTRVDLLQEIASRLQQAGISSVRNIDFRQKVVAGHLYDSIGLKALGMEMMTPSLLEMMGSEVAQEYNRLRQAGLTVENVIKFEPHLNFPIKDILAELDGMIKTVQAYQDGKILTEYYEKQIALIQSQGKTPTRLCRNLKTKNLTSF